MSKDEYVELLDALLMITRVTLTMMLVYMILSYTDQAASHRSEIFETFFFPVIRVLAELAHAAYKLGLFALLIGTILSMVAGPAKQDTE